MNRALRIRRTGIASVTLVTLFVLATPALTAQSAWNNDLYNDYTYRTFQRFGPANERIDFESIDYPLLHAAVFYETNRRRDRLGYQQFGHSPALERAATGHSQDMVRRDFFSHTSVIAGRRTVPMRLEAVGIRNAFSAENIALSFGIEYQSGRSVYLPEQNGGYFSYSHQGDPIENHTYVGAAAAVVDQWMNSPGHRANILNANYTFLGVGAAYFPSSDFHGMPMFKFTQNFSSIRGE